MLRANVTRRTTVVTLATVGMVAFTALAPSGLVAPAAAAAVPPATGCYEAEEGGLPPYDMAICEEAPATPPRPDPTDSIPPERIPTPTEPDPGPEGDPGPDLTGEVTGDPADPAAPPVDICQTTPGYIDRFVTCHRRTGTIIIYNTSNPELGTFSYSVVEKLTRFPRYDFWDGQLTFTITNPTGTGNQRTIFVDLTVSCPNCTSVTGQGGLVRLAFGSPVVLAYRLQRTVGANSMIGLNHQVRYGFSRTGTANVVRKVGRSHSTRCDQVIGSRTGCVNPTFVPTIRVPINDPRWSAVATHIRDAQQNLPDRWGVSNGGKPLHRLTDDGLRHRNRRVSCKGLVRPPGMSCDEFPFASTYEGAAHVGLARSSRRAVPEGQNLSAGGKVSIQYTNFRIIDWDRFWVDVSPQ